MTAATPIRERVHSTTDWSIRRAACLASAAGAALLLGCIGGGKKRPATPPPAASTPLAAAATTAVAPTAAATTPNIVATLRSPVTPPPATLPSTPAASPTPAVRDENGLKIQDDRFAGKVTASGGVRIRSSPETSGSNVVGSLPEGALLNVEGRVLNGAEAEQGKGTVWYIVGVKQYVYGADGYVQRLGGAPAGASAPATATPPR